VPSLIRISGKEGMLLASPSLSESRITVIFGLKNFILEIFSSPDMICHGEKTVFTLIASR